MSRRGLDPDELAGLEQQRDFLLASIADLEREHAAGDLTDEDLTELRDDYTARAAEVLRAIDDQQTAFSEQRRTVSWGRRALTWGAIGVFAVLAGWAVANSLGLRKAGESATGGINVKETTSQRASACINLISQTEPSAALDCFKAVEQDDPKDVVMLTWSAWQLSLTAAVLPDDVAAPLRARAASNLDAAVAANPTYSPALAFRAVVAFRNGEPAKALEYLEIWEETNPSQEMQGVIESMDLKANIERALEEAEPGVPGEGGSAGGSPEGSATTTTTAPVGD